MTSKSDSAYFLSAQNLFPVESRGMLKNNSVKCAVGLVGALCITKLPLNGHTDRRRKTDDVHLLDAHLLDINGHTDRLTARLYVHLAQVS